jgi:Uma2 family endonuclease
MSLSTQLLTAKGLWNLPKDGMRHELVRGELRTLPPAGGEHGFIGINVAGPLHTHVKAKKLGVVLGADTGFILARKPDTVRAADVAFVRKKRIPPMGIPKKYWSGAPDLAVEIISPTDTLIEVEEKVHEWLEAGTAMVWVVNPRRRTVTVYRTLSQAVILKDADELEGQDVVPGFDLRVREIFE